MSTGVSKPDDEWKPFGQAHLTDAIERANALNQSVSEAHPNLLTIWNTSDEERAKLLDEYLDALEAVCPDPRLIPLDETGKAPAIRGTCSLDSQQAQEMLYTPEEAIKAIERGANGFALYAGRSDHGTEDLVFADHDDLHAFPLDTLPDTLTVVSGSGEGYHETFVNAGDVRNAMSDGGEIRASNWYVVVPGSIHPSGGIYHLEKERPIGELETDDIPERLRPATDSYDGENIELSGDSTDRCFTNELGMSLDEVREYDEKLDELLRTPPRPDLDADIQDDSAVDGHLIWRLRWHHFQLADIEAIWRQYRPRSKLERDEWVKRRLRECGMHDERCRYDGSEQSITLPETPSYSDWDWQTGTTGDETALTLEEARTRCQRRIDTALSNGAHTLIDALPAMGKSSGVIRGAAKTETPISVFTARHDLYGQYSEWCEEHGLSYHRLPSFHEDCPTARGEHGDDWREKVLDIYDEGVMANEIHKWAEQYFGQSLPCDDGQECPYKQGWDFESDEYDVLIGHYQHAYNPDITAGRVAVFDEFPADSFLLEFEGDTVTSAVSAYVSEHDGLPFEDFTELVEVRNSEEGKEAREWFDADDLERDGEPVLKDTSGSANAYAPLLTYTILIGENLGNGWEHADLDKGAGVGTHRKAAQNRDSGEVFLLLPPELDGASGVIALDGTPTPDLWQLAVDTGLSHAQVLSDEERADYLTDALGDSIIQTTEATKTYSSGTYVSPEKDGLLFEAVAEREETKPALISTTEAIRQYEQEGVLASIGTHEHYGNLKGTNEFQQERVGIVAGSQHYGDDYVERWGALAGQSVERGDGKGMDLDYGEFGNKVLRHMREHEVLQAVLRFGRDGDGANIYVHTAALPEWVPVEAEGHIERWSKGTREVVEVLEAKAPNEWRTADVAEKVDISTRQVRTNLDQLAEAGYVEKRTEGRGITWVVEDETIDRLGQVEFRSS
ncbi:bifunctional DNA primase/polymerase [Haloplanus salilacus]|uniref:bifunctional DNA primase/polymerase n=1 Tax=Haloplanus salilacus TaxID=2949994 RepID=UPI0030CE9AF5